jgi:polyisoprenyl-teichoic acid--peptidoglycan teichoic acid transferase
MAFGVFVVLVSLLSAGAVGYVGYRWSQVTKYDVQLEAAQEGEPANFLLVGSDSRENIDPEDPDADGFGSADYITGERSDTIMVLRADPTEKSAQLLSIPRDLWIPIADGSGNDRINTAYGLGRQVLIDTIEDTLDITINHYVEIDFVAFRDLVDQIGGVPLWFEQPVRDRHTGLVVENPGCVFLDGRGALNFARSRYLEYEVEPGVWRTDPTADLGRMKRQQIFVRRALAKAIDDGLTNPRRVNRMLGSFLPQLGVDRNLDAGAIVELARQYRGFQADDLMTHTLPTSDHETEGGALVQLLEEREAEPVLNLFRGLPPDAVSPRFVDVEVRNGTGVHGQAGDVAAALQAIGFGVAGTGDVDEHVERTTVLYGDGGYEAARRVALHLTGGAALVPDDSLSGNSVVLVTGVDLSTVHEDPAPPGSPDDTMTTTTTLPDEADPSPETDAEGPDEPVTDTRGGDAGVNDELDDEPEQEDEEVPLTTEPEYGYTTGEPPPGVSC